MQPHEVAALPMVVGVPSDGMPIRQGTRLQARSCLRSPQPSPLRRHPDDVGAWQEPWRTTGEIASAPMENQGNNILTTQL